MAKVRWFMVERGKGDGLDTESMDVYGKSLLREMAGISIFRLQLAMLSFDMLLGNG